MEKRSIRKIYLNSALLALVIALLGFGSANADYRDYRDYRTDRRQAQGEIADFHNFLQSHPKVSTELQANPQLVYNRKYLDKHDDLAKYLKRHPTVREEVANNPERVFGRYYANDRRYGPYDGLWDWTRGWGR